MVAYGWWIRGLVVLMVDRGGWLDRWAGGMDGVQRLSSTETASPPGQPAYLLLTSSPVACWLKSTKQPLRGSSYENTFACWGS